MTFSGLLNVVWQVDKDNPARSFGYIEFEKPEKSIYFIIMQVWLAKIPIP